MLVVLGFNIVCSGCSRSPRLLPLGPEKTPEKIDRAKAWVSRHAHMFAIRGFAAVGALLIIKGIVGLVS